MVRCPICMRERGESADYDQLSAHLRHKHHIDVKRYREMFPGAGEVVSERFRSRCKKAKEKMKNEYRRHGRKGSAWRHEQDLEAYEAFADLGPNIDDLELLEEVITGLRYSLVCGLRGEEYKKVCLRLREAKLRYEYLKKLAVKDLIRQEAEEKEKRDRELMEWQAGV